MNINHKETPRKTVDWHTTQKTEKLTSTQHVLKHLRMIDKTYLRITQMIYTSPQLRGLFYAYKYIRTVRRSAIYRTA